MVRGYPSPELLPQEKLFSIAYRLKRYHTAKVGDKTEVVGFIGLSCVGCDDETKRVRGCHLPGYSYPSEILWRIDYHEPLTKEDRAEFCPNSLTVLAPSLFTIIDEALEIKQEGGLASYTREAPSDLPHWYNKAYRDVRDAGLRAEQEAEAAALALSTQNKREQEARNKMNFGQG